MADAASTNPIMTNQQPLAPSGQHDPHLYDPNAADTHRLVAVYETVDEAQAARRQLIEHAVPETALNLIDRTDETGSTGGFWAALRRFVIPDEDVAGYAESVQRGHAVLLVRPDQARRIDVIRLLEDTNPVDFDARLAEWRSAGWQALETRREIAGAAPASGAQGSPAIGAADPAIRSATTTATGRIADVVQAPEPGRVPMASPDYAGSGGFTGGTFTGTDTASHGVGARRAVGAEYQRVRGYTGS